jgi:hypothetical protein
MKVLVVIALIIGTTLMVALALIGLAREVLGHSCRATPELDNSDEWDAAADEFGRVARPEGSSTERWAVGRRSVTAMRSDNFAGSSNALDDLHSAL